MFKKILTTALVCTLLLTVFTACTGDKKPNETLVTDGAWYRNAKEHWQLLENGEKTAVTAHTLADGNVCTVCGSEIWDFGDSVYVYDYNEYGDMVRNTEYDAEGNVLYYTESEYEYDADGNCIRDTYYVNGVLDGVTEYAVGADGEIRTANYTGYYEDGARSVHTYDEEGNLIKVLTYEGDGSVRAETDYEYATEADDVNYASKEITKFADGTGSVYEHNEMNDLTFVGEYDADGNAVLDVRYEYTYDEEGRKMYIKEYSFGVPVREVTKGLFVEEDGWWTYDATEIVYNADGTKTVYEYNENGDVLQETVYGADENLPE